MAWYHNPFKLTWPNVLVGVGVMLLVPVVLPAVGCVVRPLAKGAVKAGLTVKDMVVGFAAETGEQVCDLVAEAKAEHYRQPNA
jgi:hypothetical protein